MNNSRRYNLARKLFDFSLWQLLKQSGTGYPYISAKHLRRLIIRILDNYQILKHAEEDTAKTPLAMDYVIELDHAAHTIALGYKDIHP